MGLGTCLTLACHLFLHNFTHPSASAAIVVGLDRKGLSCKWEQCI